MELNPNTLISALNRLRRNTETYFKNSIQYGATVKTPFPNSVWVYDMNTNFLEFINLKGESEKGGKNFKYYPANKANKDYIILSYRICDKIREIFQIRDKALKAEKINNLAERILPELRRTIDDELLYWENIKRDEASCAKALF